MQLQFLNSPSSPGQKNRGFQFFQLFLYRLVLIGAKANATEGYVSKTNRESLRQNFILYIINSKKDKF